MRFSIIVPVYNVADYLSKCVNSLLIQRCDSFEIILVDDGSTDGKCPALCDELAAAHPDLIRVYHQSNGGLYYESYAEFEKCLEYLLAHRDVAGQMARNGGQYVRGHFAWDVIVRRYREYFDRIEARA